MAGNSDVRRRTSNRPKGKDAENGDLDRKKKSDAVGGTKTVFALVFVIVVASGVGYFAYMQYCKGIVNTPLSVSKINAANSSSAAVDPERFWGTYRSNLYFGMKTRTPRSPVFGLMWLQQLTEKMPPPIRHWCDQGDQLKKYGWFKHDGRNFGIQEIEDNGFVLRTEFVKRAGGQHGGDWTARIVATNLDQQKPVVLSLMYYVALDGQGRLEPEMSRNRLSAVRGYSEELGDFTLNFPKSKTKAQAKYSHLITYTSRLDQLKEVVSNAMKVDAWDKQRTQPYFVLGGRLVPRDSPGGPNFMVQQVTVQLPFEMEIIFESGSVTNRPDALSDEIFLKELAKYSQAFDEKFSATFNLEGKGYSQDENNFAKAALSNMLGGIGYFYGSSVVQSRYNEEPVKYWPAALYSGVPSRSFFPRGFLWDEGFHNLLISRWDIEISKDIISHWLDLMNTEGWIPREQILGVEARARVPQEFVVQRNENANPPTFFLPLQRIIQQISSSNDAKDQKFMKFVYPRLKVWYNWYNSTQTGKRPLTYRWRGRDSKTNKELNPKTLTSGLDDYPRASHPTDDERHVDLRCWMAFASGLMADIAEALGEDPSEYKSTHQLLTDNKLLNELHWSQAKQQYSDYGLHTDKIHLQRPKPPAKLQPGQPQPQMDKIRVVSKEPEYRLVDTFGYVSLFPFLLRIIDADSVKLFQTIAKLQKPEYLWTDYGLRSLSKNAHLYNRYNTEHDPPYWRGAIWINMNYLALGALHHYSVTPGKYQETARSAYKSLRQNVVRNIFKEYRRTGYIWEQYSDNFGSGKGTHPFTGWSALVVLIMAEEY